MDLISTAIRAVEQTRQHRLKSSELQLNSDKDKTKIDFNDIQPT